LKTLEGRDRFVGLVTAYQGVGLVKLPFPNRKRAAHNSPGFLGCQIDGHLGKHGRVRLGQNAERGGIALAKEPGAHVALPVESIPAFALAVWVLTPIPGHLLDRDQTSALTIEDRNGVALRSTRASDGSRALWVAYRELDPDLINGFIALEDRRFWDHHGIDIRAMGRALQPPTRISGAPRCC